MADSVNSSYNTHEAGKMIEHYVQRKSSVGFGVMCALLVIALIAARATDGPFRLADHAEVAQP